MNLFKLSWSYLQKKRLNTFLNILLLAFGVGIIIFLLLVLNQAEEKLRNNAKGIDYVIGAKGSPLQLILNAIYHMDTPTGNIPLAEANAIANNKRLVKRAIPLALGDSYKAYRMVGTTHEYVDFYKCKIAKGKLWKNNFEVTIGAAVARKLNLKPGSKFHSSHGLEDDEDLAHKEKDFVVTGILAPSGTVADRLILTNIESVWEVHGQHDEHEKHEENHSDSTHTEEEENPFTRKKKGKEITAMLIQRRSNMAIVMIPAIANRSNKIQAASPAREYLKLLENIGIGVDVLTYFAYIIIFIAGLSIFIALYNALKEREYDLAIMRTLGATRAKLFTHIILEGVLLAVVGGTLGFLLGHGGVEFTGRMVSDSSQMTITGLQWLPAELGVMGLVLGVAFLAALIPAIQIYRIDISKTLAK